MKRLTLGETTQINKSSLKLLSLFAQQLINCPGSQDIPWASNVAHLSSTVLCVIHMQQETN